MGSLNWKQLVVASLILTAGATGAYYLLKHAGHVGGEQSDATVADAPATTSKSSKKRQSKKKGSKSGVESVNGSGSQDSITTEIDSGATVTIEKNMSDLASLCEQDSETLLSLGVEDKQKVFYALLLKGEAMMNQGRTIND